MACGPIRKGFNSPHMLMIEYGPTEDNLIWSAWGQICWGRATVFGLSWLPNQRMWRSVEWTCVQWNSNQKAGERIVFDSFTSATGLKGEFTAPGEHKQDQAWLVLIRTHLSRISPKNRNAKKKQYNSANSKKPYLAISFNHESIEYRQHPQYCQYRLNPTHPVRSWTDHLWSLLFGV